MECVILIGIQGSGKSTFYKEYFFNTHVRINLDLLKTRHNEDIFLAASFKAKQKFVVDNTNPTRKNRNKYIQLANTFQYKIKGYFMEPDVESCLLRNERREGKQRVPTAAINKTVKMLEEPSFDEGFDELFYVRIENEHFVVSQM